MAAISNLFIDQGSDYSNIISVKANNGQPLNLDGYTVKSQIRKSFGSNIAFQFNATVFSSISGRIRLQLSASDSEQIPPGRYLYDVEITSQTGFITRVVEGVLIMTPQITKI